MSLFLKMQCEICGREGRLFKARVESSEMIVCEKCSKFGNILKEINENPIEKKFEKVKNKEIFYIRKDYSQIIKKNREKINLKQEELAKKMNLKESMIHKIESGAFEPSMELAKKFEKFFNIKLIEKYKEEKEEKLKEQGKEMTIGDILKEKIKY